MLGVAGDIEAETEAILLENDVETEDFPDEVSKETKKSQGQKAK